ncbi:MAG TPA: DUF2752 domain-containing protein [Verrucomicrobiae bacterium]
MQARSEISVPLTARPVPPIVRDMRGGRSVFLWCGGAAVALAAVAVLFRLDPALNGFYPRCFFHTITGWDCPGCGGLRATHQLLHGHWREAFELNPLFVVALPIICCFFARPLLARLTGRKIPQLLNSTIWVWIAAVVVIGFGVLRNLPWRAWLASAG